ncbi:MAG: VOC family protein [Planctomycetes bacterium]|nr:VOC family protein [Planctomycetota bacterium]
MDAPAPDLGWFALCIAAKRFPETYEFYRTIGFTTVRGKPEHGWVGLNNAGTDLAIMRDLPGNWLNFRGGDVPALAAEHRRRGLEPNGETAYDPKAWPEEWHTGPGGRRLPLEGAACYSLTDPDGNTVYFDTVPLERVRYVAGQRFCQPEATGRLLRGQRTLGRFELSLRVKSLRASLDFYTRLGLGIVFDRRKEGFAILGRERPARLRLGLYRGHIRKNLLTFRGADVFSVASRLAKSGLRLDSGPEVEEDGSAAASLSDPESNVIYLNTMPGEKP